MSYQDDEWKPIKNFLIYNLRLKIYISIQELIIKLHQMFQELKYFANSYRLQRPKIVFENQYDFYKPDKPCGTHLEF